jgi:hypothetical protein
MESRAFPAFSYDPAAGGERTARFSLEGNPQPERDWPLHGVAYEDAEQQRVREELPFTLADFAACDERYTGYFARIPRGRPNGEAPHLTMVDRDDCLQKAALSACAATSAAEGAGGAMRIGIMHVAAVLHGAETTLQLPPHYG